MAYFSYLGREKRTFCLKACLVRKKRGFRVLLDVSSPRRRCGSSHGSLVLLLGEGIPPRRGHACLGKLGDSEDGISGPPKQR